MGGSRGAYRGVVGNMDQPRSLFQSHRDSSGDVLALAVLQPDSI